MDTSALERVPLAGRRGTTAWPDGTSIKGYTLTYFASGGMSTVYLGKRDGRDYILKEVPSDRATLVMAITQEKGLLERLDHPGIVKLHGLFEEHGYYYLVMEYIEGVSLRHYATSGGVEESTVRDWGVQLCNILEHLHQQNPPIIYRDLKPENILLADGKIRLIDFGIARIHKGDRENDTELLGSVATASPEHYGGAETDARSDIYTLGATLYDLLAGGRRFQSGAFNFAPITEVNPRVSTGLEETLKRALALHPEDRFQTMEEFRRALVHGPKRRVPWKKLLITAIVLFLVATAWTVPSTFSKQPEVDTGFGGDVFTYRVKGDATASVALGEEIGLINVTDGFGLKAGARAAEISERLNKLYHTRCAACGKMKLEPEGFRVGKVLTGPPGKQQSYTVVFYAHIDHGNYFEPPLLLATIDREQARAMGATEKFGALYWRDMIRDLVQLSRGRHTKGPLWPVLGKEFLAARGEMSEGLDANNLRLLLQKLQSQKALQIENLLETVPADFASQVDTFPPIKVRVYRKSDRRAEFHPLAG